ncbi:helix-turn-helix domain-containing protein (plasmid) [Rhodococcus qingshengii]|nr:helix-turn-helix domain-containing protein [Rhodococcus qingshengii]
MVENYDDGNLFRFRLNALFAGSGRRLYNKSVVKDMRRHGKPISVAYLSQLRTGARSAPSDEIVFALASYFRVTPDYFFSLPSNGSVIKVVSSDTELISRIEYVTLRSLLVAANGLSEESLRNLVDLAVKLRVSDGCSRTLAD